MGKMKEKQDVDIWVYSFMLNMRWNSFQRMKKYQDKMKYYVDNSF